MRICHMTRCKGEVSIKGGCIQGAGTELCIFGQKALLCHFRRTRNSGKKSGGLDQREKADCRCTDKTGGSPHKVPSVRATFSRFELFRRARANMAVSFDARHCILLDDPRGAIM